ncbi:MAG: hypothetical protein RKP46_18560 [Candidatus Accumulibacter sp.]|uniref:hypothetical protein n=1 Tax=Accumulibacter sp. TaxID=2053492 RepID=UPI0028782093|nr:hypothetical protein [Accumulibacter sp.]MDS4016336.1 hypothetical protein [Accumulibacter sp.]
MNSRRLFLLSLLVVAAYLAFLADKTPSDQDAARVVQPLPSRSEASSGTSSSGSDEQRSGAARGPRGKAASSLAVAALVPRANLIPAAANDRVGRDLFPALSWTPPPPPPPPLPAKPLPPIAPPVPFTYLGKKLESGQWEVYLGRGDEVFIVREGMLLNSGNYQVKSINPPTLTLEYLALKQSQTISIGGSQ